MVEVTVRINPKVHDGGDVATLEKHTTLSWTRDGEALVGRTWTAGGWESSEPWQVDKVEEAVRRALRGREWTGAVTFGTRRSWEIASSGATGRRR